LESHPDFSAPINNVQQPFCCLGCQAVALTIAGSGLADFYRFRSEPNNRAKSAKMNFSAFDDAEVQKEFVVDLADGTKQANLIIAGISCAACVWLIERHLKSLPGVLSCGVNSLNHRAFIKYNHSQIALSDIFIALTAIGYNPEPQHAQAQFNYWREQQRTSLIRLGVAGISMMQAGMVAVGLYAGALQGLDEHWQTILRWITCLFAIPVVFYSSQPFYSGAWRALSLKKLNMDVSVSIALLIAFFASFYASITQTGEVYFESIAMFAFILLAGRYIEQRARFRNFQQGTQGTHALPLAAARINQEQTCEELVPVSRLQIGDQIKVTAGEVFPCDGTVISGESYAIESLISGESQPQAKVAGSPILAGSINGDAALIIAVTATGPNTQLAKIEQLMDEASTNRPKQLSFNDRISSYFIGIVLVIASGAFIVWHFIAPERALWIALSVLVVTCPCALAIAMPAAWICALNHLRQKGVLIKSSEFFERINKVTHVVFDKTGTLTDGELTLANIIVLQGTQAQALGVIASLEANSVHPIAQAFTHIPSAGRVQNNKVVANQGVEGSINGTMYRFGSASFAAPANTPSYPGVGQWLLLTGNGAAIAWVQLQDKIRPQAKVCIEQLNQAGYSCEIISGDRKENVAQLASQLGVDRWRADSTPQDKLESLRRYQTQHQIVMMVGDGINDVPVLAGADASLAMGRASTLAQTQAQAVLIQSDLSLINYLFRYAARLEHIIKQNFYWALAYNCIAIPAAVLGLIPPWLAAVGMSTSSLIVIANSLRLT
jgi:Cu2+-exporting ATPase